MSQKFRVDPSTRREEKNGAISYSPGGPFDCLGHFAKIINCPIDGAEGLRLTCYATGYADTAFSVPACTRYKGQHIGGFFTCGDGGPTFKPYDRFAPRMFCPLDDRYTLTLEHCGDDYPRLILRFCGDWVSKNTTLNEAHNSMHEHATAAARLLPA